MWLFVAFDLPVKTKKQRKQATGFRKELLAAGFWMMQYSLYVRPCPSEEHTESLMRRVQTKLPPLGQVRIFQMTDKQWERMKVFVGKTKEKTEDAPKQLELF